MMGKRPRRKLDGLVYQAADPDQQPECQETQKCRNLYASVVERAILDAYSPTKTISPQVRSEAKEWLHSLELDNKTCAWYLQALNISHAKFAEALVSGPTLAENFQILHGCKVSGQIKARRNNQKV